MKRYRGRALSTGLIAVLGTLLCVVLIPASASALTYELRETFGSADQPSFLKAEGLAVDQSNGDLLVIDAEAGTVSRWNPDGSAADFLALGSNVIDGKGPADETPQNGLTFGGPAGVQVAVDDSGGETDGNIYVTDAPHGVIDIFGEDGSFLGQLTASSEGAFKEPCGVGVDSSGEIYVGDFDSPEGAIHKYQSAGLVPVNGDNTLNFNAIEPCTLAAGTGPSAGFVFVASFKDPVRKFFPPVEPAQYVVSPGTNTTVTVNPATGNVFIAKETKVNEFDASSSIEAILRSSFSVPSEVTGIAVDKTSGAVYVARVGATQIEVWTANPTPEPITEAPSPVGPDSATLHGSVDPKGLPLEECFFEWGETKSYGKIAPCKEPDAEEVGEGSAPVAVHAELSGLQGGTTYHFRLLASNEKGTAEGLDEEFKTLGPGIRNEAASQVTASGARISGEVNPNGKATSFIVQYVTDAKFSGTEYAEATTVPVSPKAAGSGTAFAPVTLQLSGLLPETTYHFRIVATNSVAANPGLDETFTTFSQAPSAGLPDGRVYEMVSPPQKAGEIFPPNPGAELGGSCSFECLPGGGRPMAPMQASPDGDAVVFEGQPFSAGQPGVNEYMANRTPGGWETAGLSSPLFQFSESQGFKAFSADLSRGIVYQIEPALSPEAPSSEGESFANLYLWQEGAPEPSLEPLINGEPPQRDPGGQGENRFNLAYAGANAGAGLTPAFSHVVFSANDALTEASAFAPEAPEIETDQGFCQVGENCNLYEWVEGELRLVNVLPGNIITVPKAAIGSRLSNGEPPAVDHAISDDGSRIFWSDETGQVFVRIDGKETRKIEAPGRFLTASSDGSKVLLGGGCLYDLEVEPAKACDDLTGGKGGFEGILGAAEDLSRVYFVDTAVLDKGKNANGEEAEENEFNLYVWEEGAITYIGTLLPVDNHGTIGDWKSSSTRRSAQVSPDGRYLAFMSTAELTGYDNSIQGGGKCLRHSETPACFEVFEYDADPGKLTCASCNPSGQRPIGESNLSLIKELVPIPAAPFPAPHNLTTAGQGRLFFESQDSLSPRDTNEGIQDVYEWEPNGVGSCEQAGGCVFLISSGKAAGDSMFFNSTPSGDDAFLVTRERLLSRDKDEKLDLYDARAPHVPGEALGFPEGEIAPCGGEACAEPIATPPAQPGAASSNFSGPGNQKPHKHKKHRKKHKVRHAKKRAAKHNRGGSR